MVDIINKITDNDIIYYYKINSNFSLSLSLSNSFYILKIWVSDVVKYVLKYDFCPDIYTISNGVINNVFNNSSNITNSPNNSANPNINSNYIVNFFIIHFVESQINMYYNYIDCINSECKNKCDYNQINNNSNKKNIIIKIFKITNNLISSESYDKIVFDCDNKIHSINFKYCHNKLIFFPSVIELNYLSCDDSFCRESQNISTEIVDLCVLDHQKLYNSLSENDIFVKLWLINTNLNFYILDIKSNEVLIIKNSILIDIMFSHYMFFISNYKLVVINLLKFDDDKHCVDIQINIHKIKDHYVLLDKLTIINRDSKIFKLDKHNFSNNIITYSNTIIYSLH